jgi:excisionase family DNA binding protein
MSERAVYTVPEAAERLRVSPGTLYAAIRAGEFDHIVIRVGGAIRLPRARLDQLLDGDVEQNNGGS